MARDEGGGNRTIRQIAILGIVLGVAAGAAIGFWRVQQADPQTASSCPATNPMAAVAATHAVGDMAGVAAMDRAVSVSDLAFSGPDKAPMTMADFSGRVVLLNLWATWCAPCREEMPDLDALQAARGGEDFEVVALNLDRGDDTKPEDFYAEVGLKALKHYRDGTLATFNRLRGDGLLLGLPATLLVDRKGCVAASLNGPAHWGSADAVKLIDAARGAE